MRKLLICLGLGYAFILFVFLILPRFENQTRKQSLFQNGTRPPLAIAGEKAKKSLTAGGGINPASLPTLEVKRDKALEQPKTSGPVETFYENGKLSSEWNLLETGEGLFKTYLPEGSPGMEMPFKKQRLEGSVKTYHRGGALFTEEEYIDGRRKILTAYYPKGSLWLKLQYRNEGLIELEELYSEDGRRADQAPVSAATGQAAGYFKAYDASGHEVLNWQQAGGEQEVVLKSYYLNGTVSSLWDIKNKKLNGRGIFYYPDGKAWIETGFLEGKDAGRMIISAPDSRILLERNILIKPVAGEETKAYYPDGKIFWVLTSEEILGHDPLFRLRTYWQSDAPEKSRRELLKPVKEAHKGAA